MTREEAAQLCAFVAEACPSQPMGEFAADVWAEIIPASYTLAECREAVGVIIRRGERWVDAGAIVAEVRRARTDAADRERVDIWRDRERIRREIEEPAEEAFLRKLDARTGGRRLRELPPPDYGDEAAP